MRVVIILRLVNRIAKWAIVKGKSVIVRVTLENAVLTYTNARSVDVTSSETRYEQNRLHYSRKFGETYYRGPGWSKAIDFTTRFGFSKGIARAPLKKRGQPNERERNLPRYINSLSPNNSWQKCFGYQQEPLKSHSRDVRLFL